MEQWVLRIPGATLKGIQDKAASSYPQRDLENFSASADQPCSQKLPRRHKQTRGETKPLGGIQGEACGQAGALGVFPSQAHPWDSPEARGISCDSWVTAGACHCLPAIPFRMCSWVHKHSLSPRLEPNIPCGLFQPLDFWEAELFWDERGSAGPAKPPFPEGR